MAVNGSLQYPYLWHVVPFFLVLMTEWSLILPLALFSILRKNGVIQFFYSFIPLSDVFDFVHFCLSQIGVFFPLSDGLYFISYSHLFSLYLMASNFQPLISSDVWSLAVNFLLPGISSFQFSSDSCLEFVFVESNLSPCLNYFFL